MASSMTMLSLACMAIPAGLIQPPFFNESYPAAVNYARIGRVVGHEMMHGFDEEGSKYDAQGHLRNWFQQSDLDVFKKRMNCVVSRNSRYYVPEVYSHLDGVLSQAETAADIGGLREAFRGYKKNVQIFGHLPTIPGFNVTHYKLFFLAYAQGYCEKAINEWLEYYATSPNPPNRYRINSAIQNTGHFHKYYNCPRRTEMNPATKCHIWSG